MERVRQDSSQVSVPDGFTQSVMNRIFSLDNGFGRNGDLRPAVTLRWRVAAACISGAAAVLLKFGVFSVNMPQTSVTEASTEPALPEIPVLTREERMEIYIQAKATTEFIAEWNK